MTTNDSDNLRSGAGNESEDDQRLAAALVEYQRAAESGTPPNRAKFLARFPDLANRLDDCLNALAYVDAVVSPPPRQQASDKETTLGPGSIVGEFRLVREVGRGGMGVVYEAIQQTLGRRVAVKVLPVVTSGNERAIQRFRHEAQAAATLQHPHIVPIFAVGRDGDVHYFAMQFIEGRSLQAYLKEWLQISPKSTVTDNDSTRTIVDSPTTPSIASKTDLAGRASTERISAVSTDHYRFVAQLITQAADALHHAHECGIVHRDIKPGNLLVDAKNHLWVADFGLAKLPGSDLTGTTDVMGTLRYMSPEQASGRGVTLDGRADIYSLGISLYELLTRMPAFDAEDQRGLLRKVIEEDPVLLRKRDRMIPIDLETICLKAIAKEPFDRYQTAAAFRDDLQRFLDDRPIEARPPTLNQRTLKWVRRNRAIAMVIGFATITAAIISIVVLAYSNDVIAEKQRLTQNALNGQVAALEAEQIARGESQERLRQSLVDQAAAVRLSRRPGQRLKSLDLLQEAALIRPSEELRNDVMASYLLTDLEVMTPASAKPEMFPVHFFDYFEKDSNKSGVIRRKPLKDIVDRIPFDSTEDTNRTLCPNGRYLLLFDKSQAIVWDRSESRVAFTPSVRLRNVSLCEWTSDNSFLVTVGHDNKIHVYELSTGNEKVTWEPDPKRVVTSLAVQPIGQHVAVVFGSTNPGIRVFELFSGRVIGDLRVAGTVNDILWSRTGHWLAAAISEGFITLWRRNDLPGLLPKETGSIVVGKLRNSRLNDFLPTDDLLLINSYPRTLSVVSPHTLEVIADYTPNSVPSHFVGNRGSLGLGRPGCMFSADGRSIGWLGESHFRIVQPDELQRLTSEFLVNPRIEFSADSRACFVTSGSGQTKLSAWSMENYQSLGTSELPKDGRLFLNGTPFIWTYQENSREVFIREARRQGQKVDVDVKPEVFTKVPKGIRVTMSDHSFKWWPKVGVVMARAYHPPAARMAGILTTPQDIQRKRVAVNGSLPGVYCWPPNNPAQVRFLDVGVIREFALDQTGRFLATQQAKEDQIKIWDYSSGQLVRTLKSSTSDVLQFSDDGQFLVQYGRGSVTLWRTDTWTTVFDQLRMPVGRSSTIAFSADSRLFAVGDEDDVVIYRTSDLSICLKWKSPGTLIQLKFSPDGRRLVGCTTNTVWVWNLDRIRRQLRGLNLDWSDDPPGASPTAE